VAIFVVGAGTLTLGCDSKFLVSYLLSSSTRLSWRTLWSVTAMWRTARTRARPRTSGRRFPTMP